MNKFIRVRAVLSHLLWSQAFSSPEKAWLREATPNHDMRVRRSRVAEIDASSIALCVSH